jgi:hypothetical protein
MVSCHNAVAIARERPAAWASQAASALALESARARAVPRNFPRSTFAVSLLAVTTTTAAPVRGIPMCICEQQNNPNSRTARPTVPRKQTVLPSQAVNVPKSKLRPQCCSTSNRQELASRSCPAVGESSGEYVAGYIEAEETALAAYLLSLLAAAAGVCSRLSSGLTSKTKAKTAL